MLLLHVLKNALAPAVSVAAIEIGALLGGNMIVETIFAWPGVGRLVVEAIFDRNYPLVQAAVLLYAVVYVVLNFVADLLYACSIRGSAHEREPCRCGGRPARSACDVSAPTVLAIGCAADLLAGRHLARVVRAGRSRRTIRRCRPAAPPAAAGVAGGRRLGLSARLRRAGARHAVAADLSARAFRSASGFGVVLASTRDRHRCSACSPDSRAARSTRWCRAWPTCCWAFPTWSSRSG